MEKKVWEGKNALQVVSLEEKAFEETVTGREDCERVYTKSVEENIKIGVLFEASLKC